MNIYHTMALLAFLVFLAALLIRYVHNTVDREFRNLAQAMSDKEFRGGELARTDSLLVGQVPVPEGIPPLGKPGGGGRAFFPPVLLVIGIILLWGGLFAKEERSLWGYSGLGATLLAAAMMLATLRRRKWERTARLLRLRGDLRRMDGNHEGSAADLRELVRLTPWDDAAWAELSDDLASQGDLDGALDAIRQASHLDPRYDEYRMLEASLSIRLGRTDDAREAVKQWMEMDGVASEDPRLAIYSAAIELAEGRREEAAESLRNVLLDEDGRGFEFLDTDSALEGVKDLLPGLERDDEE